MKKNSKKLTLKKETICDLNEMEMNQLKGEGLASILYTNCNQCTGIQLPTPTPTPKPPLIFTPTPTPPLGQSDGCYSANGSDVWCCA